MRRKKSRENKEKIKIALKKNFGAKASKVRAKWLEEAEEEELGKGARGEGEWIDRHI